MRQEDTPTRVSVIPADDLLSLVMRVDLLVNIDQTILGERQIDASLSCMACRQGMFDNDELFPLLGVHTPLSHQYTSHFVDHITR